MSRINDLIKELCPNGVSKYEIKDICKVTRGRVISKMELAENAGDYPVYSSQTLNNGVFGKINTYDFEGEYVQWTTDGANAGSIFYRNGKFSVTNVCGLLKIKDEYLGKIKTNYLAYALTMESKKYVNYATSNPKLMSNVMERITVLIPPLEVQTEIVRILDKFGELEAEIEAELEARRSQYEFWREKLCGGTLDDLRQKEINREISLKKLSEVGTIVRGKRFVKADAVEIGTPCMHYGELYTYYGIWANKTKSFVRDDLAPKLRYASKNDVIIVGAGENNIDIGIGVAWLGDENIAIHDACYIFTSELNPKYVSYYLRTNLYHNQIKKYVSEGKICAISGKGLGESIIPVPSLEEQERIVNILDKFDKLVNDISVGLPAEIEARRKQYEYYRNKLLSFKEVSCE